MRATRVWLIGGTHESALLAGAIAQHHMPQTVTVTTDSARSLYPTLAPSDIWTVVLTPKTLPSFLASQDIGAILDASHPFATGISELAIATATDYHLPYLRYERPATPIPHHPPDRIRVETIDAVLDKDYIKDKRVLLTVGYRFLHRFKCWQDHSTLFARILPSLPALNAAREAGFSPERLIALRPPLSIALETALYQHWDISTVITKASGRAGGEDIKQQATAQLGLQLITIDRPLVSYPQQTHLLEDAIAFCRQHIAHVTSD
ncbi:MAG: cobalt-precorrin-6A reductase [Merismopedia sp. SIO2A8]|nr:cobalt-precorrin-6A reductase [Symploca sp. SIO2B6]NET49660.1 cobalt-precorrin-6A reductase [Merismopedia sp. SIO2A8]